MSCPQKYVGAKIAVPSYVKNSEFFANNCVNKWSFKDYLNTCTELENPSLKDIKAKRQEYINSLKSLKKNVNLDSDILSFINDLAKAKDSDLNLISILRELATAPKINIINSTVTNSNVIALRGNVYENKGKRKLDEEQDENFVSILKNKKSYCFIKPKTPEIHYNINSPSFTELEKEMIDDVVFIKLDDTSLCNNEEIAQEYKNNKTEQQQNHFMVQLPVAMKFLEGALDQQLNQLLFWMGSNGFNSSQSEDEKKAILFIRLVLNDFYANCIKPVVNNVLNERTPFVEYVKGVETNKFVSLYHKETNGRRRFADGIGYIVDDHSEALLIESSGEEDTSHAKEDTLKLLECSIRALKMEMEKLKFASLNTFKARRFYTMLYSKDKLTMLSTSLVDSSRWGFTFVREATFPRTWNKRHGWLSVFELVLCLNDKLKKQQEVSLLLLKEHNGWVKVEDGDAINDFNR
ncbi:uncharacterized protein BX663DRAFT_573460 [Cokeromyces recurvatus]|uniref:uncharacterized protein n=1 Tax=Cokeromyces recurvatus TaxID=90255 RepID=UPI00221F9956|nr:uncharacterized protein BX663DRAFT_573460 [Cokeromyces recurvatus]KAI7907218.1 hypothetical protein BX663DRAFT_573460 [Cokeromyces recurvatus]